jgi:hypothetical protein
MTVGGRCNDLNVDRQGALASHSPPSNPAGREALLCRSDVNSIAPRSKEVKLVFVPKPPSNLGRSVRAQGTARRALARPAGSAFSSCTIRDLASRLYLPESWESSAMPEMSPGGIGSSVRQLVQATAAVAAFGKVNAQPSDQSPTSRPAPASLPFTARTGQ